MNDLRVVDNDQDEIAVYDGDKEVRRWSYESDTERRAKMLCAREFVEGYYCAFHEEPLKSVIEAQGLYQNPINQVAFRGGFIFCREIMARFVEQGGDAATARSIRANWMPQFDADPGKPRRFDFAEITTAENPEIGPWKERNPGPSVEGAVYALGAMLAFGIKE